MTLYKLLYNKIRLSHKLSQIYKQYLGSILSNETRYDLHNYLWYYRPSIIDPFTLIYINVLCYIITSTVDK